jgi:hypothetical protein
VVADGGPGFAAHPYDDFSWGTARAYRLRDAPSDRPSVVVLGGSGVRESILGEAALADSLSAAGVDAWVAVVGTADQTLWETEALRDLLPGHAWGLLVVGVGPARVAYGTSDLSDRADRPLFGFRSPVLHARAEAAGLDPAAITGIWPWDQRRWLLMRGWSNVYAHVNDAPPVHEHYFVGGERIPWERFAAHAVSWLEDYQTNAGAGFLLLDELVGSLPGEGFELVLLEGPSNPAYFPGEVGVRAEAIYADHHDRVRELAERRDVPILEVSASAGITTDVDAPVDRRRDGPLHPRPRARAGSARPDGAPVTARRLGVAAQALVLGLLGGFALLRLIGALSAPFAFRYMGF